MNKEMEKKELKKNRRGGGKDEERDKGIRKGKEDQGWGDKTWGVDLCHFAYLIHSAVFYTISEIILF